MSVFQELIDPKILKIVKVLSEGGYFHLQKISRLSKVSMSTTFRIVKKLVRIGVVDQMVVDKTKLYKIANNKKVDDLSEVLE